MAATEARHPKRKRECSPDADWCCVICHEVLLLKVVANVPPLTLSIDSFCWCTPRFKRVGWFPISGEVSWDHPVVNLLCIICLAFAYVPTTTSTICVWRARCCASQRRLWTQYRCRAATPLIALACRSLCRTSPLDARSPAPCAALLCLENYQRCVERTVRQLLGIGFCSSWIAGAAIHGQWTVVLGKYFRV